MTESEHYAGPPLAAGTRSQKRKPLMTFQAHIDATHPDGDDPPPFALKADALAMQLVHERHAKRDLVNLVRWLILRNPDGLL